MSTTPPMIDKFGEPIPPGQTLKNPPERGGTLINKKKVEFSALSDAAGPEKQGIYLPRPKANLVYQIRVLPRDLLPNDDRQV